MTALDDLEAKWFPVLGPVKHTADTQVTPIVDGEAYFNDLKATFDGLGAGDFVYIATWRLDVNVDLGAPAWWMGDTLVGLAAAGVDVRAVLTSPWLVTDLDRAVLSKENLTTKLYRRGGAGRTADANVAAARALRSATDDTGATPLADRVLLDWGGQVDSRHEKIVVTYQAATHELRAWVGGIDPAYTRSTDSYHRTSNWHDAGVRLVGGAAVEVLRIFNFRWEQAATLPVKRYRYAGTAEAFNPAVVATPPKNVPPLTNPGDPGSIEVAPAPPGAPPVSWSDAGVRVVTSYEGKRVTAPSWSSTTTDLDWEGSAIFFAPSTSMRDLYLRAIGAAQRYIYVEDQTLNPANKERTFWVTHEDLFPPISAACARGVKVIFVSRGASGGGAPVQPYLPISQEVNELILDPLTAEQQGNFAPYHLNAIFTHTKVMIIDDEFLAVGSANFWDRSTRGTESEASLAMVHPGGSSSMAAEFRIRLWRENLGVLDLDPTVTEPELRNLDQSLGIFDPAWGGGVTFPTTASRLVRKTQ